MRILLISLCAVLTIGQSMAKVPATMSSTTNQIETTNIESSAKTATKKGQVLVKSPRIPKPKIFRSNPYRASYYASVNDNDDILIFDDDIATGYRRQDLKKIKTDPTPEDPEGIITEEIRWKLFLARQLALLRYRELHGNQ